jgi:hypothetical protein
MLVRKLFDHTYFCLATPIQRESINPGTLFAESAWWPTAAVQLLVNEQVAS